ncbi:MAG: response regulator [Verrucomicrobiales bacterium]
MSIQIIIVEDSPDDVALLRRALNVEESPDIKVFRGGLEALRYFHGLGINSDQIPDLVVLDLQLPDLSGAKFLEKLKEAAPSIRNIPVAVVSNHIPLRQQIEEGSVLGCFEKPFRYEEWKQLAAVLKEMACRQMQEKAGYQPESRFRG